MNSLFITGTDTGAGKTVVTGLLAHYLEKNGMKTVTQKWIQTGCFHFSEDLEEHLRIMHRQKEHYLSFDQEMAPYIFEFPASPHLAADMEKRVINDTEVKTSFKKLKENFEMVLAEGAGGLLVPYNRKKTIADIVKDLQLPVLIVAKNKLGVINHTLLTVEVLKCRGLEHFGIIFNADPDEKPEIAEDNIDIVNTFTGGKVLGNLIYSRDDEELKKSFEPIGDNILEKIKGT